MHLTRRQRKKSPVGPQTSVRSILQFINYNIIKKHLTADKIVIEKQLWIWLQETDYGWTEKMKEEFFFDRPHYNRVNEMCITR